MNTTELTSKEMEIIKLWENSDASEYLTDIANSLAEIVGHQFSHKELEDLLGIYSGHDYCIGIFNREFYIIDEPTLDTSHENIEKCDSFCTVIETALECLYSLQELLADNMDISEDVKAEESAELDRLEKVFDSMKDAIKNTSSL